MQSEEARCGLGPPAARPRDRGARRQEGEEARRDRRREEDRGPASPPVAYRRGLRAVAEQHGEARDEGRGETRGVVSCRKERRRNEGKEQRVARNEDS